MFDQGCRGMDFRCNPNIRVSRLPAPPRGVPKFSRAPRRWLPLALLVASLAAVPALAEKPLAKPSGPVILTISGAIDHTNADRRAEFDRTMLQALGTTRYATSTAWTDGRPQFEGVLARDILKAVGARGTAALAVALNDYSFEIPISDFEDYAVLFALEMNGARLTARDKGPIWIVYPRDRHRELQNQATDSKWVWQLAKIEVR